MVECESVTSPGQSEDSVPHGCGGGFRESCRAHARQIRALLDFFSQSYLENWSLFVRAAKLGESETGAANSLLAFGNRACKQGKAKQRWAKFRDSVWIVLLLSNFHCLSKVIYKEISICLLSIIYYLSNLLPSDFVVPPTRVNGIYFPSH